MTVDYTCLQIDIERQLNNLGKLIELFHHKGTVVEKNFIILFALFLFFIFK